jgi:hypothetical protein
MQNGLMPYTSLKDNARQVMEFNLMVFGGKLLVNSFSEFQPSDEPGEGDKIMRAVLGFVLVVARCQNLINHGRQQPQRRLCEPGGKASTFCLTASDPMGAATFAPRPR